MNKQKESVKEKKRLTDDYEDYLSEYLRGDYPSVFFTEELEESEDGEVLKNVYIYGFESVENRPDFPRDFTLNPISFCGVYDKEGNFLYNNEPSEGHFYIENYEGSELDVYEFDPFTSEFDLRLLPHVESEIEGIYWKYENDPDTFQDLIDTGAWINIEAITNSKVKELVQNVIERLTEKLKSFT